MKTFVYVISGDHGRQKIGITDDPRRRIKDLQTGSPYALRFEFLGETEDRGAGPIEVEAHFMLAEHKAPGGDEWFVVPPDVAITAVMAAAHRIGYRLKPVDPDAVGAKSFTLEARRPTWVVVLMLPLFAWFAYWLVIVQHARVESGEIPLGTLVVEGIVVGFFLWAVSWIVQSIGNRFIAVWSVIDRALHPENGPRAPLPRP